MRKTYQPTINLLKPVQEELNKALRNPVYAFTYAENIRRSVGCAPSGAMFVQPVGMKMPTEYETYTDADTRADTHWYFIDDPPKFTYKEKRMDRQELKDTVKGIIGIDIPAPKEPPEAKELNVEVDIQIKDGHILAEFGCVKHICHNLTELMVLAKKELLKEMPILKDFGKVKESRFSPRNIKKFGKALDEGRKEGIKQAEKILADRTVKQKPTDSQKG